MDNHINHDASRCVSVREDVIEGAPVRVSRRETMRATVGGIALVASGAVSGLVGASIAEAMGGESTSRNVYLPTTDAGETGAYGFSIVPPSPPEPVKFPRPRLRIEFAVCLLRSAYEAIDDCDVMAMDKFQATQWRFRASEWEPYKYLYEPLKIDQGAIGDPLYFDFASFVQMATAAREIPKSTAVFEERTGAEGVASVVRRDESLRNNSSLPEAVAMRCGNRIYDRLLQGFDRGEDFEIAYFEGVPKPVTTGRGNEKLADCVEGMRALAEVFVNSGYALKVSVDNDLRPDPAGSVDGERKVRVRVNGPATLWGSRELKSRGYSPTNEYLGYTLTAFLARSGVLSSYTERVSETEIDMTWRLRA